MINPAENSDCNDGIEAPEQTDGHIVPVTENGVEMFYCHLCSYHSESVFLFCVFVRVQCVMCVLCAECVVCPNCGKILA